MMTANALKVCARRLTVATLVSVCTGVLSPACRAADAQPPGEVVKFHDLRLDRPEGVAALYGRLRVAAGRVCSTAEPDWQFRQFTAPWCIAEATDRAILAINSPVLTEYHLEQKGKRAGNGRTHK